MLANSRSAAGPGRTVHVALIALLALCGAPQRAHAASNVDSENGLHWKPSVYWQRGDHRIDVFAETRYRVEWWDAHASESDAFHGLRTRVTAQYSLGDLVTLSAQFQDARIWGLGADSSGVGGLYRTFSSGGDSDTVDGQDLRQGWLELRPAQGLSIRGGRTDINLGTEVRYPEPNWNYLKIQRASQRLVGTVGWTHGERSNDGGTLAYDLGKHHVVLFGAQPTTGVFDIERAYRNQGDITYGGLSWTVKRDTWLLNTEIRAFFLAYDDDRPVSDGGLLRGVEVYTFGFSTIGIYPWGPGNFDLLVWGAGQGGEYDDRDHWAGAGILELGYQLPDVIAKPWLRAGVNLASGGGPTGDHNTFFNMLPTNHLYYGFADQLAFQNLLDVLVQLKLRPHEKLGLNLMVHHFRLLDSDDGQYFGTGAFTKKGNFGFGSNPSFGKHEVGTELDATFDVKLHRGVSLQGGYSYVWGGDVWRAGFADEDVEFAYLQLSLKY